MATITSWGGKCKSGCPCDPDTPAPTEHVYGMRGAAWMYKHGVPSWREHVRTVRVDYVTDGSVPPGGTWLDAVSGVLHGVAVPSYIGLAVVALNDFSNAPFFYPKGAYYFQMSSDPAHLVWEQCAVGKYGDVFPRHRVGNRAAATWYIPNPPSYLGTYGYLKGTVAKTVSGVDAGQMWVAQKDGAAFDVGTQPDWSRGVAADFQIGRRGSAQDYFPHYFQAGQFCDDVVDGISYVAIATVDTGALGASGLRPGLDATNWRPCYLSRQLPWRITTGSDPLVYEAQGNHTTKVAPKKRFREMREDVVVTGTFNLNGGAHAIPGATGSRVWTFHEEGFDREHNLYTQAYAPALLSFGDPGAIVPNDAPLPFTPTIVNDGSKTGVEVPMDDSAWTLVSGSATETVWTMVFRKTVLWYTYGFAGRGQVNVTLTATHTVTLGREYLDADITAAVVAQANGNFDALYAQLGGKGSGWNSTFFYTDGTVARTWFSPSGLGANDPASPYQQRLQVYATQAGFTDDVYFTAEHIWFEYCYLSVSNPDGTNKRCVNVYESSWAGGVRTGGVGLPADCAGVGALHFEHSPNPGNIMAFDYTSSYPNLMPC